VENPLANRLLKGEFKEDDTILVDAGPDGLSFNTPGNNPIKKTRRSSEARTNKTQE
jgi:hypothetical protein